MKRLSLFLGLAMFIALPAVAHANGQQLENILVPAAQIINDNFVRVGQDVTVDGTVQGDLIVAGRTIVVTGPVAGDILAAGETVRINGPVAGNIRIAAKDVILDSTVGKNATIFADTIQFTNTAKVGWSLQAFGSSIDLAGLVSGNANFYGSNATVRGTINGNARFVLGEEGTLHLTPTAIFQKDLTYQTNQEAIADTGATVNGTIRMIKPIPHENEVRSFVSSFMTLWRLASIFGLLVVGLVILAIIPKSSAKVVDRMRTQALKSIGWGILLVIVPPLAALILLLTIIGIPLAILGVLLWAAMLYIVRIYAGLFIGTLFFRLVRKDKPVPQLWALILGVVVFSLLTMIPIVGWIIGCIGAFWALGAIGMEKRAQILVTDKA